MQRENGIGYAYADISTGVFVACETYGSDSQTVLFDELTRLAPSEIVANEKLFEQDYFTKRIRSGYYLEKLAEELAVRVGLFGHAVGVEVEHVARFEHGR